MKIEVSLEKSPKSIREATLMEVYKYGCLNKYNTTR